jgi:hypothetical protein
MKRTIRALWTSLMLASLSLACAHSPSQEFTGESYTTLKQQQIANPDAGQDAEPIEGIASTTADHVTANYHERQQAGNQDGDVTFILDGMPGHN